MTDTKQEELKKLLVSADFKEETYENIPIQELIILKNSACSMKEKNLSNQQAALFFTKREEFFYHMVLRKLQKLESIYVLFSKATNMPYVVCDPESCNDQVWIFSDEKFAKKMAVEELQKKRELIIMKIENKHFLGFYLNLYPMGVNELVVDRGVNSLCVELKTLVTRPDYSKVPAEKRPVINPEMLLTAIYFAQERSMPEDIRDNAGLKDLEEEMLVNLKRGKILVPIQVPEGQEVRPKDMKVPYLKLENGDAYQPVFSDGNEFQKFSKNQKLRAIALDGEKLSKFMNKEVKGILLNPAGVRLAIPRAKI
ncbi:MAG: SseB family protein [Eubacteriales bacterium]|nr:SseB family protein [Eubacteriales bacterium]